MKIGFYNVVRSGLAVAAAVVAVQAVAAASPASAQYGSYTMSARNQEAAIERAFDQVLRREPSSSEMRRYKSRMTEDHWNEADVRDDLRSRNDYRGSSKDRDTADVDRVIRRAYDDILHRAPDNAGLRQYRREMLDNGWSEQDVRQALRKSPEHGTKNQTSADRIIQRAYQDILGRKPDYSGLVEYRNQIMNHGWDDHDVREALKRSPEYRQKNTMTRAQAEQIVNRAYRSVLGREADPQGMEGFVQRVLRDHWSESQVARELRNSDEYRNKGQDR
jgi:TorA maturation chaperone TorD